MMTRNLLAGFRDEMVKIAAVKKKSRTASRAASVAQLTKSTKEDDKDKKSKMELGKRWREGSPFGQQTDDPRDISIPYERDGANLQHGSPEAVNSENDSGSR